MLLKKHGKKLALIVIAETKLIELGVYDDKGQLISQDPKIIQYYEKNWI